MNKKIMNIIIAIIVVFLIAIGLLFIRITRNTQKENEHSFYGKIVESHSTCIIVEPLEDEEERNLSDKISIGLWKDNDALYIVGTTVKVTYDGTIMESYPAQINATKIEVQSTENF